MHVRPIRPDATGVLQCVHVVSDLDELAQIGWSQKRVEDFLSARFDVHHHYYNEQFPNSEFQVVMLGDQPIGRLYVGWWKDGVRLIDIALLPGYRNQGIGTALIEDVMRAARGAGMPVRLHVERLNPALRLYERLGFQIIEDRGLMYSMEWRSGNLNAAT